jgi:hypothetical protein
MRALTYLLPCLLMAGVGAAEPPERPAETGQSAVLSLTRSQQQAVGIRIEEPQPLTAAPQIQAYGTVLDPVMLVTDMGRAASTRAAAAAAAADATRLERLYRDDTQASLKAVQAAQAQAVETTAQARAAAVTFRLQWGPVAHWSSTQQNALLAAASQGHVLLMRADVPGEPLLGAMPRSALVQIAGVRLTAQVLGALPRAEAQSQSASWLLQLQHAPEGLGPGTRAAVQLLAAPATGLLVPTAALVYGEQGAYVYCQVSAPGKDAFHYRAVSVRPLARVGNASLLEGLARGDRVVVEGAGVLWSLQGFGTFSAAEEEHD